MRQEEKSVRSRFSILEAALQLFSTRGYHGTSIRDVAKAAGVSTGNVYHHFPDKETVFRTLLDQYWAAIASPEFPFNRALAAGAFPNDLEALARAAEESVRTWRRHISLIYVDVVEFDGSHIHNFYAGMSQRFASFLQTTNADGPFGGKLRPGVSPLAAVMLASRVFLHYFSVEVLFGVPGQFGKGTDDTIREIAGILRHGMLSPDGGSAENPGEPPPEGGARAPAAVNTRTGNVKARRGRGRP